MDIMTPILLASLLFLTPVECTAHLDARITSRPSEATVTYLGMSKAVIGLHGATVVLRCVDNTYSAHLL